MSALPSLPPQASNDAEPDATFEFSLVKITEPRDFGKQFGLKDGQLVKSGSRHHLRGVVRRVRCDIQGLRQIVFDALPGQHICSGVPDIDLDIDAPLAAEAIARPGDITRTLGDFKLPAGPGLMVFDSDGIGDRSTILGMLWRSATSSGRSRTSHCRRVLPTCAQATGS